MRRLVVFLATFPLIALAQPKIDKEQIRLKIKDHLQEVRVCYEESLKQHPEISGKIVVDFEINDMGKVSKSKINEGSTTLKEPGVQSCITDQFKTWSFPAVEKGKTIEVTYPFMFSK